MEEELAAFDKVLETVTAKYEGRPLNTGYGWQHRAAAVIGRAGQRGGESTALKEANVSINAFIRAGGQLDAHGAPSASLLEFAEWGESSTYEATDYKYDVWMADTETHRGGRSNFEGGSELNMQGRRGLSGGPIPVARCRIKNWRPVRATQKVRDIAVAYGSLDSLNKMENLVNLHQYSNVNYGGIFTFVARGDYGNITSLDKVNIINEMVVRGRSDSSIARSFPVGEKTARYIRSRIINYYQYCYLLK